MKNLTELNINFSENKLIYSKSIIALNITLNNFLLLIDLTINLSKGKISRFDIDIG